MFFTCLRKYYNCRVPSEFLCLLQEINTRYVSNLLYYALHSTIIKISDCMAKKKQTNVVSVSECHFYLYQFFGRYSHKFVNACRTIEKWLLLYATCMSSVEIKLTCIYRNRFIIIIVLDTVGDLNYRIINTDEQDQ